jgi:integrase
VPTESDPVTPVPDAHVWAVCQHVPPVIRDMILTQYHTGCRPGEVCRLAPVMLDTSGKVWIYRPTIHKTKHKGKTRTILFGPRAQAVIAPYLKSTLNLHAACFSPVDATRQGADMASAAYQPPVNAAGDYRIWPSYQKRRAVRKGRSYATQYCPKVYAKRIARVCADHGIPHWHPNQLRHNAGTRMRKEFSLDVAQAVLGHSKADITQIYAQIDLDKAMAAMEKVG